jgi:hypothetical protein
MPTAVIERVNWIGENEPSILTFTNRHGEEIGNTTQDFDLGVDNETDIKPLADEITGVEQIIENGEPTGVDFNGEPTGVDFDAEPTGVEVEADHGEVHKQVLQEQVDNGLGQQVPAPEAEATTEPSSLRHLSHLTKKWRQSNIPSHKDSKYDIALTQVTKPLQGTNNATY